MLGVIAIRRAGTDINGGYASDDVYFFRLRREYDQTGTFTFGSTANLGGDKASSALQPDTCYEVRVGTLTLNNPNPDTDSISSAGLAARLAPAAKAYVTALQGLPKGRAVATFRTGPARTDDVNELRDLAFLLGSCRYPGTFWATRRADRIFAPMRKEALGKCGRPPAQLVLMMGDQIYADKFTRKMPIGRADTCAEFQERYMTAFGSPNMRCLLRSVPTYMILDDHEIENNWHQDRIYTKRGGQLFNFAIEAYRSYQWLHGPRNYGDRLFYSFDAGGYPFFVLDTRTQRYCKNDPNSLEGNHMLGWPSLDSECSQLSLLLKWLVDQQEKLGNVPKFIVSPSVFVPNRRSAREGRKGTRKQIVRWKERSDSWPAFPHTRRAILRKIVDHSVQNVIFLSGDIHCANVAKISFKSPNGKLKDIRMFSITSSALYWPFCFADGDPSKFVHDSTKAGQEDTFDVSNDVKMNYEAWNFTQQDNFCRVEIDCCCNQLIVTPFGTDGKSLAKQGLPGTCNNPLKLACWRPKPAGRRESA